MSDQWDDAVKEYSAQPTASQTPLPPTPATQSTKSDPWDAAADEYKNTSAAATQQEKPGYFKRLGEGLGLPTTREELEQAAPHIPHSWGEAASTAADLLAPGASQAARMLAHEGKKDYEGIKDVTKDSAEAGTNIAEGGPIGANLGKAASAVLKAGVRAVPIIGEPTETAGEDIHDKNYRGAAGDLTAAVLPLVTDYIKDNPGQAKEFITSPVRGAAKTYNVAKKVSPYVAPVVGAAEGYAHGGLPGMAYGSISGGTLGKVIERLPYAPESVTKFGLPKVRVPSAEPAPLINEGENWREPEGFDSQPERGPEASAGPTSILEKVKAEKSAASEPEAVREPGLVGSDYKEHPAAAPQDLQTARNIVKDQSEQELIKAGKKYGVDHEDYDFKKRDANRHRVERDQFVNDVVDKMPDSAIQKLVESEAAFDDKDSNVFDQPSRNGASRAERARAIWDKAHSSATSNAAEDDLIPEKRQEPALGSAFRRR